MQKYDRKDTVLSRFLRYISFDTQSDEENDTVCPSTPGQVVFAKALADELKKIGMEDVDLDDHGYVMATLPAMEQKGLSLDLFLMSIRVRKHRERILIPCWLKDMMEKILC